MNNILVSVIVPVYNAEFFLVNTLESILKQTYQEFEVICVNDCSTDNSLKILKEFGDKDSRIKIYDLEKNLGCPGLVRNYAVEKSRGKVLAFLDSDDVWKHNKLELQLNKLTKIDSFFSYTGQENRINDFIYKPKYYLRYFNKFHIGNLLIDNTITTSTVIMSKKLFYDVGGFRREAMIVSEDYELWIKSILNAKEIYFIDEILMTYYINPTSITNSKITYINIYWNTFRILKKLILSKNSKNIIFAIFRFLTLPLTFLYYSLIQLRRKIKK